MATASDVTIAQDGAGNAKLHPYLIALVRWCVSCVWSTASVLVHRLVTAQLPPITASRPGCKPRAAGTDHLHPEPRVECVVLHAPAAPTLDVVFMHGLYGSLGNTWRQGDWRSKYKLDPTIVPLRNHAPQPCSCPEQHEQPYTNTSFEYETNLNETEINETVSLQQINGCFKKILPHENSLITEKFYNNTLLNVNNYETQGKFVTELFKNDCNKNCDLNIIKCNVNGDKCNGINKCKCKINKNAKLNECDCGVSEDKAEARCEAGCGCVCDDCYSACWPRDWVKEDFPGARVISVNYTSDPYLWRPLWVKGSKRLRLHERAEQMISQLLELGVGQRPIVWVGHSKGGLFIKQIYCEAYDAYMKLNKNIDDNKLNNNTVDQSNNNDLDNNYNNSYENANNLHVGNENGLTRNGTINMKMVENSDNILPNDINTDYYLTKNGEYRGENTNSPEETENLLHVLRNTDMFGCGDSDIRAINEFLDLSMRRRERADSEASDDRNDGFEVGSSNEEEDLEGLSSRASLWEQSVGFMFYSVPHRGSPLAAIKTPITARSIELLEISKDCPLVVELQARWLAATSPSPPAVRSLVETCRTLMSVLWLRIVSVDSADAGVGSLLGVSVDHREICKPSSRRCALYAQLAGLVRDALARRARGRGAPLEPAGILCQTEV